jgi:hypothetical protein
MGGPDNPHGFFVSQLITKAMEDGFHGLLKLITKRGA